MKPPVLATSTAYVDDMIDLAGFIADIEFALRRHADAFGMIEARGEAFNPVKSNGF